MVETLVNSQISTLDALKGRKLHSKEFDKHFVTIYDSGILLFEVKRDAIVTARDLEQTRAWLSHFGERKYLNLFIARTRAEVEDDFRLDAATSNQYTIADAIVVNGISQRIMANLYLRFNKPATPTKVFADEESAAFWLMSFT
ncbi:DUF7793 family protein [Parvicella tangerina]|uniref:DUF7793 domain-containing protein n=1 Tax=Parvicella tangerina TaxID=2829795 RepID=A0A916NFJ4_9FLAO|nr:hypothetical protein [Parvicella tangerina]CAG5077993.1 hypothetical protein CRYO30217_00537 [Parvicella tangerina]